MASDGPKQHGLILSLAIVDELHAHRDSELYTALRTGMLKRRDARIVTITTAGADDDSALGELRRRALELPKVRRSGYFTEATGPNLALFEWSLPDSSSIDDMALVKEVNPASWLSEDDLAEQREAVHEATFRRYHCNQWVAGIDSAISPTEWADCAAPGCRSPRSRWSVRRHRPRPQVGQHRDRPDPQAGRQDPRPPPDDPGPASGRHLARPRRDIRGRRSDEERWPSCTFVLDPEAGGETLAQRIDKELGGMILTHSQRTGPMSQASALLSEAIAAGQPGRHPDDPALTKHVLSATAKFIGTGWRFTKQRGKAHPIDAVIALAMAVRVLLSVEDSSTARPGEWPAGNQAKPSSQE